MAAARAHLGRRQRPGLRRRPLCVRLPVRGGDRPHLWLESPGWQQHGRTWVDGNVQAFAADPSASGYLYVEGTDHTLWLESPGWQQHGRTWVDGNVQAFAADPSASGYLYVEGTDHTLWLESPGWQQHGRTWVDGNVQAFAADPSASGYLYVEGTDHTLWLESPGWQQHGRTWVDGNVQAFAADPSASGYLYVEGTNGILWLESPGWQQYGTPGSTATSRPSPGRRCQTRNTSLSQAKAHRAALEGAPLMTAISGTSSGVLTRCRALLSRAAFRSPA